MCGIAGILARRAGLAALDAIDAATDCLRERGPDGRGVWREPGVALGHRRLAIIDTSERGAQPMHSGNGRYVVTYNGEIYNYLELRAELTQAGHTWRSDSDTEVILAAYERWGAAGIARLNGMFAIAIYDREQKKLLLARDRLGVKPLFYASTPDRFVFGSRPRALLALAPELGDRLSMQAIRLYVESGYVPAPWCVYEDIRKLPPGHCLEVDEKGEKLTRYWTVDHLAPAANDSRSEPELLAELDELLGRSVRSRMISDVPLGAFLSGGIDSALVVAKMAQIAKEGGSGPVRTYTIG